MKKALIWLVTVLLLCALQTSFLPLFSWNGISPDLLLVFSASVAFLYDNRIGAFAGFMTGLLQDLATGGIFGINTFSKLVIGYACGSFSRQVFKEKLLLPIFSAVAVTTINYAIIGALIFLLGYPFDLLLNLWKAFLPMLVLNIIPAYPLYVLAERLQLRFAENKKEQ